MNSSDYDDLKNEYQSEIADIELGIKKDYENALEAIKSGSASSYAYIHVATSMLEVHKSADKKEIDDYLEKGFILAQKELRDPDKREEANLSLAVYYKTKKDYKKAAEYFSEAAISAPESYFLLVDILTKNLNDKKGAIEAYEKAKAAGADETILKLIEMDIQSCKTKFQKFTEYFIIAAAIIAIILLSVVYLAF